jgi:hypothetical protein
MGKNQDPESRIKIPDPKHWLLGSNDSRIRIPTVSKNRSILTKKIVSKLPDPDLDFFTYPGSRIQGSKRHRIQTTHTQETSREILTVYRYVFIL